MGGSLDNVQFEGIMNALENFDIKILTGLNGVCHVECNIFGWHIVLT